MDISVFCYHNALAASLEKDLAFLAANGYETLVASELVDVLTGVAAPPAKPVAVTFDDGLLSVKTVGLALLERYGAKATVFAITGLVPDGRTEPGRADDLSRLLGWDDLRELSNSGRLEVGSHGHRHNPVQVGAEEGAPVSVAAYGRLYDVPLPFTDDYDEATIRAVDSSPSRPSQPLFAADNVIIDGAPVDAAPLVAADLRRSATLLRERLGAERLHLCLPYGAGSETLPDRARTAGFESVFWSRRDDRAVNQPGDDPFRIVRRKHDFLRRLPGRGRRSLAGITLTKVVRRFTADPWE